jgi:predicted thioredoxin/glutaredoxin
MAETVTVYTRVGCHLCDEAIAVVRAAAEGRAHVELVDIDADPDLHDRYTVRVPVVAVDGVEIAQYQVAPEQIAQALSPRRRRRRFEPRRR